MSQSTIKPSRPRFYVERGERLYTSVLIELVRPNRKECHHATLTAPNGKGFDSAFIWETIEECGKNLSRDYPNEKYDVVALAPDHFKFVYGGQVEYVN